jgi:hypothetical protein
MVRQIFLLQTIRTLAFSLLFVPTFVNADEVEDEKDERDYPLAHEFYFTRGIYSSRKTDENNWGARWAVDFPKADHKRLTGVDAYPEDNAIRLSDRDLTEFPFLYVLEVGSLLLSDDDARALRKYLLRGGFMVVDDFWGTLAWRNFEQEMARVLPDYPIVDVPLDHPIFHAYYDIAEIVQVPNVFQAAGGVTHEYDGYVPRVRGIFDQRGRLLVLVNWNTDLGDAWEWADSEEYPLRYSSYAYELGINFVVYAMTY